MEDQEDPGSVDMNLDARQDSYSSDDWQDSSSFDDVLYTSSQQNPDVTTLVGTIWTSIVGIGGGIVFNDDELLELVRYPQSDHADHAIKVFNSSSMEVGYLYDEAAFALSPLIDAQKIILECEVADSKIYHSFITCRVRILAKSYDSLMVKDDIEEAGLELNTSDTNFGSYEGMRVKENSRVGKMGTLEPPKEVIETNLLDHQKEGLWWLVDKEKSDELPPFWEVKDGLYVNVLTRHQTDHRRPQPLHSGIFADDYGLGKTLTLLSLIALDKVESVPEGTDEGDEEASASSGKTKERVSERGTGKPKIHTLLDSHRKESSVGMAHNKSSSGSVAKQTLIVCPSVVCSTWENQLQEHTKKGSLKLYKYYRRTKDVEELKKYDIVLTTYSTLVAECFQPTRCPLRKIEWWRVILDEAHVIKNANAKQSRAVTRLTARRRWAVTGTPIQNGSFDLFSLMAFLRLEPLSTKSYWQRLLQRPLAKGDEKGIFRLQDLMATISLRRKKDEVKVGLPLKTVDTVRFQLSREEREMYDQMEAESKHVVGKLIDSGKINSSYSSVLYTVLRLRRLCNDSALCSDSDVKSLLLSDNIGDASQHPVLLRKMLDELRPSENFECRICLAPPTHHAVITICQHIFCKICIWKYLPECKSKGCCPICRRDLSWSVLFSAPLESFYPGNSSRTTPSKVLTLIELLKKSRDAKSASNSVVFSLFDKTLVLLEEPLKEAGFKILRLDASTDVRRTAEIIKEFGSTGPDTVMLASLKSSGAGINLTAASRVYLLEPWWNSEAEEQAIDRVHQYGQKENVRIIRLIADNTIEERILEMQRNKLENEALGRQGLKERREVSIDDLRGLLSL